MRMKTLQTNPHQIENLEKQLAVHTLASEQRRAVILAWVLGVLSLLTGVYGFTGWLRGEFMPAYGWILLLSCLGFGFEVFVGANLARSIRRRLQPAKFRFYLNALLELTMPTAAILIVAKAIGPSFAVTGPASYSYFLFIILSALRLDVRLCLFTGIVAAFFHAMTGVVHWHELQAASGVSEFVFRFTFFARAMMFVIGGLVAGFVASLVRKSLLDTLGTVRERERIVALFGQHVSPAVVDQLIASKRDEASLLQPVCVLVLDIRNFTGFSEKQTPEETVALLNSLWSFMVRAVNDHHGFINKFLGDGFLAVFGAPISEGNDSRNALNAANRILRELDGLVAAGKLPPTKVGMAVHAGDAIVGNVGSDERKEYTVIGDVVNVAFRLEALNKDFGSRLLLSEPVREAAGLQDIEALAPIQVRGREEPVQVYRMA